MFTVVLFCTTYAVLAYSHLHKYLLSKNKWLTVIISEVEHPLHILSAINLHDRQMIPKLLPFPKNDIS